MESKNYIQRIRTNIGRRAVELITTEDGKKAVEMHIKEDKLFAQNLFNTLPEDKKILFKTLLCELLSKVEKESLFSGNDI